MTITRKLLAGLAPVVLAAALAVPGAAGAAKPSKRAAAHKVERILKSEGAAESMANSAGNFAAVAKGFTEAATKLHAVKYPRADKADAKALEAALDKLSADATMAEGGTAPAGLATTLSSDAAAEVAASDALRADLGLPAWHKGEM